MRLSLWDAEVTGNMTTDRGRLSFRHFVHATAPVHVLEMLPLGRETVTVEFVPLSKCVDRVDVLGLEPDPFLHRQPRRRQRSELPPAHGVQRYDSGRPWKFCDAYWLQMFQIGLGMREDGPVRDEIGP